MGNIMRAFDLQKNLYNEHTKEMVDHARETKTASHQEIRRCLTKGESEESAAYRQRSTQARDPA